MKKYPVLN